MNPKLKSAVFVFAWMMFLNVSPTYASPGSSLIKSSIWSQVLTPVRMISTRTAALPAFRLAAKCIPQSGIATRVERPQFNGMLGMAAQAGIRNFASLTRDPLRTGHAPGDLQGLFMEKSPLFQALSYGIEIMSEPVDLALFESLIAGSDRSSLVESRYVSNLSGLDLDEYLRRLNTVTAHTSYVYRLPTFWELNIAAAAFQGPEFDEWVDGNCSTICQGYKEGRCQKKDFKRLIARNSPFEQLTIPPYAKHRLEIEKKMVLTKIKESEHAPGVVFRLIREKRSLR
jgi:hypothetical protein